MWLNDWCQQNHTFIFLNAALCCCAHHFHYHLLFDTHFVIPPFLFICAARNIWQSPCTSVDGKNTINNSSRFIFCFICCSRVSSYLLFFFSSFGKRLPFGFVNPPISHQWLFFCFVREPTKQVHPKNKIKKIIKIRDEEAEQRTTEQEEIEQGICHKSN